MALEFQLGSDILNTTIAPTFEALTKLGAIALIQTFLNYPLGKELKEFHELEDRQNVSRICPQSYKLLLAATDFNDRM